MQALKDIRILDITRALAGPFCTMMLGDLGAEVIKVERPGRGDESRGWGPPFVGEPYGPYPGESAYFLSTNRNKQSITINLKSTQGQQIIRQLAMKSDVFVENYRTGVLDKMGLGYQDLQALNPGLVYCSISGYGRTGPYAERPGYDAILQAEGGMMGITGPVEGPPSRAGIPIIDINTGMFAATAILAALRARDLTGEGQLIDISLFDAHVALLANVAGNYLVGGNPPQRYGNGHPNLTPYQAFQAKDRWFVVGAANENQWALLCKVIGREDVKDDPRFASNGERIAHRGELNDLLSEVFITRAAEEWLKDLREGGLPCGPINSIPDVFAHPQAVPRSLIVESEHPTAGTVKSSGFPYKLSKTPADIHRPPPMLGEHNQDVLINLLGYSPEDVAAFEDQNVL